MKQPIISKRELDILQCVAQGCSTKEIAVLLHISSHTVETHRKNILKKLEAKNMIEALSAYKRKRAYYQLSS